MSKITSMQALPILTAAYQSGLIDKHLRDALIVAFKNGDKSRIVQLLPLCPKSLWDALEVLIEKL